MAITIDTTNGTSDGVNASSKTISFTVGSGSDDFLVVAASIYNDIAAGNSEVTGVTYNGVALTQAIQYASPEIVPPGGFDISLSIWYLINPASGAHNMVLTCAGEIDYFNISTISAFGVAQTTPLDDTDSSLPHTNGTNHQLSLTTTESGDLIVDSIVVFSSTPNPGEDITGVTVQSGQTQTLDPNTTDFGGQSYKLGGVAGANTIGWDSSGNYAPYHVGAAFKPVAAGAAGIRSLRQIIGHGQGTRS